MENTNKSKLYGTPEQKFELITHNQCHNRSSNTDKHDNEYN